MNVQVSSSGKSMAKKIFARSPSSFSSRFPAGERRSLRSDALAQGQLSLLYEGINEQSTREEGPRQSCPVAGDNDSWPPASIAQSV